MDAACDVLFFIIMLSTLCTPLEKIDGTLVKDKRAILQRFTSVTVPRYLLPSVLYYVCVAVEAPEWVRPGCNRRAFYLSWCHFGCWRLAGQ